MVNHYIIPVFVPHKGCPHDCVFCNQKKITGLDSYSSKDENDCLCSNDMEITSDVVENLLDTYLASIHSKNKDNQTYIELSFFGGSFTAIPISYQNELLAVANAAKNNGRIDAIRLSTRPDYIDHMILDNLKLHGVDIIELGVQSMDDEVLDASERGHNAVDVKRASHLIKEYGFQLGLQMMIGLPKDTLEKDVFTANEIVKLEPDFVRIYPTLVIKATKLEQDYYEGVYVPLELNEALEISKKIYEIFTLARVHIIRLGLQATEQINLGGNGDIVAGPFHPAFRELVEGMLLNDMLYNGIKHFFPDSKEICVEVSPKDISKLYSDKKVFFHKTKKNLFDKRFDIRQNPTVERMTLHLRNVDKTRILSLYDFLNWKYQEGFFLPI